MRPGWKHGEEVCGRRRMSLPTGCWPHQLPPALRILELPEIVLQTLQ